MTLRLLVLSVWAAAALGVQNPSEFRVSLSGGALSYYGVRPEKAEAPVPLLIVVPPRLERAAALAAFEQWNGPASSRGWALAVPFGRWSGSGDWADASARLLEAAAADASARLEADPARVYLAASGDAAPVAFYAASRIPHRFAAAAVLGGDAWEAIETNRLFGANTALVPVLWAAPRPAAEPALRKLEAAGYNAVLRPPEETPPEAALEWLSGHRLERYPAKVDCETGNSAFARCYWIQITRFDPAQRNDALPVSRVPPSSGAFFEFGRFGYSRTDPGPGVQVERLPENYRGPLRIGDRIVAVGGRPVENGAAFQTLMDQLSEERPAALMVQRGGQRLRLETSVVLPRREENFTARIQAQWFPDTGEVLLISRGVSEMRLELPAGWLPARLNWNGEDAGTASRAGCWMLAAGAPLRPCPP
jgi:hypothetical protein